MVAVVQRNSLLSFSRHFTTEGTHPEDMFQWKTVDAVLQNARGEETFRQDGVEAPEHWSPRAIKIVAEKYLRVVGGVKETSVRQLGRRVARFLADAGVEQGLFDQATAQIFFDELLFLFLDQRFAFNSPVWFNVGVDPHEKPQSSACFIQSVQDTMESIMDLEKKEVMLFKQGSGTGGNLSPLRSSYEKLRGGGFASGPVSYMKPLDKNAGVTKSGGTCLAPHQRVYTAEGPVAVKELAERGTDFVTLSFDPPANRYKAKTARAWLSGEKEVYRVTTDKGVFELSFDHPMKLSSGEYIWASRLKPGMSLFACSIDARDEAPRVHLRNGKKGKEFFHRLIAQDVMGEDLTGRIVHHKNENRRDNRPENLQVMLQSEHAAHHGKETASQNAHVFQTQHFSHNGKHNGMHRDSAFWQDEEKTDAYRAKQAADTAPRAKEMQQLSAQQRLMNTAFKVLNAGYSIDTFEKYCEGRTVAVGRIPCKRQLQTSILKRFGSYDAFVKEVSANNHRVKVVELVGMMPVYDVEVDCPTVDDKSPQSGHNFVIWPDSSYYGAGVVISNTRRAAKMVVLNIDHPDILECRDGTPGFIRCKSYAEQVAHDLYSTGKYSAEFNVPNNVYDLVDFQNANNSVRITDDFMVALDKDARWATHTITDGKPHKYYQAKDLWREIAEAAWFCGDPGVQFHDTTNKWHTCKNTGPINASNPCCFVGATQVDTSEGRIAIEELEAMFRRGESLPRAFSFDRETKLPVLRQITRAWVAGQTARVVEVHTDKGLTFRCTPEHRWLTYNGEYVEAAKLQPGQRLRKIGRDVNDQRSGRRSLSHRVTETAPNGMSIQARWMWEQANGQIPSGFEVHHVNGDPTDDRLTNLRLEARDDHRAEHARGAANPRFITVDDERLLAIWDALASCEYATRPGEYKAVTPTRWNKYVNDNGLKGIVPLAGSSTNGGRIRGMSWTEFTAWVEQERNSENDRVVSVTHIDLPEEVPVYDIEVDGTHNFGVCDPAIDSPHSIVVHNSEYLFLDDSACNLGSWNLLKFWNGSNFDSVGFIAANRFAITAMELLVDASSYPSRQIAQNAHDYRPLGIGYANLGALLMHMGVGYDSNEGRAVTSAITSLMSAGCYHQSAQIARLTGPFAGFQGNREPMLEVINMHYQHSQNIPYELGHRHLGELISAANTLWNDAAVLGKEFGYRNAQISVIAPTGTISFMMDCETTGCEPMLDIVVYKKLVGGGLMRMPNEAVVPALQALGYSELTINNMLAVFETTGALDLKPEHRRVFQTAIGSDPVSVEGHLRMMAAIQPFISGGISKTVNMASTATVDDVARVYRMAWELGLKCVAIFRDGCKLSQPASSKASEKGKLELVVPPEPAYQGLRWGERKKLPDERPGFTHKGTVGGQDVYFHVGLYDDGAPGEVFIDIAKAGSTLHGVMDMSSMLLSVGLQHGVPLPVFIDKLRDLKFEPEGMTRNRAIPFASSISDYLGKWLEQKFIAGTAEHPAVAHAPIDKPKMVSADRSGPPCRGCGSLTVRSGACWTCTNCGSTTGCG